MRDHHPKQLVQLYKMLPERRKMKRKINKQNFSMNLGKNFVVRVGVNIKRHAYSLDDLRNHLNLFNEIHAPAMRLKLLS